VVVVSHENVGEQAEFEALAPERESVEEVLATVVAEGGRQAQARRV
jgi:hypothetical protein